MDKLELVTPAASAPVTAAEAKRFCGVEDASFDALFAELIDEATAEVEDLTARALMEQSWRLYLAGFSDPLVLPRGFVSAVTSVKYDDAAGVEQTLSAASYVLDLVGDPQTVVRADGASWPVVDRVPNPVRVLFVTGYEDADAVPARLKLAVKQIVAARFEDRLAPAPRAALETIERYRAGWYAA